MTKAEYKDLIARLQLFFVTSWSSLDALVQGRIFPVLETVTEQVDEYGTTVTFDRVSKRPKVDAYLTNCLGDPDIVLRLGRIDPTDTNRVHPAGLIWGSEARAVSADSAYLDFNLGSVLSQTIAEPDYNLFHMRMICSLVVSVAYETADDQGFANRSQEFEFLRHLRNAVSHNNTFTLHQREPNRPAQFNHFVIDRSLNGFQPVLFHYLFPGDVYDLLEFIKTHV